MSTRLGPGRRPSAAGRSAGIVLSGYYGFGNAGDEAILEATVADLRAARPDVRLTVLSAQPGVTGAIHGVGAVGRFSPLGVWRALGGAQLLISGGGSLLQDVTSSRSLWYYLALLVAARLRGLKTMVYANGLGPIRGGFNRRVSGEVLRRTDLITLRDPDSLRVLVNGLGVRRPEAMLTADPAFGLRPLEGEARRALLAEAGLVREDSPEPPLEDRALIGLALRPWPGSDGLMREAVAAVAALLREDLAAGAGGAGAVLLIPMQYGSDRALMVQAQAECAAAGIQAHLMTRPLGPREALTLVSACHMVIAMRLHALIFAAGAGVPPVAISYDPKVGSLIEYLAGLEAGLDPGGRAGPGALGLLRSVTGAAELGDAVRRTWRERRAIAQGLRAVGPELRRRAQANAQMACGLLDPSLEGKR